MTTPEEHYLKAEEQLESVRQLLEKANEEILFPAQAAQINLTVDVALKVAQVHATLATASDPADRRASHGDWKAEAFEAFNGDPAPRSYDEMPVAGHEGVDGHPMQIVKPEPSTCALVREVGSQAGWKCVKPVGHVEEGDIEHETSSGYRWALIGEVTPEEVVTAKLPRSEEYQRGERFAYLKMQNLIRTLNYTADEVVAVIEAELEQGA